MNWRRAQWVVLPLLIVGAAEGLARRTAAGVPRWYEAAGVLAARERLDVLFIGTSRVEAAIVPRAFEQRVFARTGRRLRALNLGRGHSTDVAHFFGVRNLLLEHPDNLRGVTVFAEAPGGLPFPTFWRRTPWAGPEHPWLLVDLLRQRDLRGLWRFSGLPVAARLHVTARWLLRPLVLFHRREHARAMALDAVPALAQRRWRGLLAVPLLGADLDGPGLGSIRTDVEARNAARAGALQFGGTLARSQAPMRKWDNTVVESLVSLVHARGGRVVFFEPPLSEVFQRPYRSPLRQEDRRIFVQQAQAWGSVVLAPDFPYTDLDLPDYWHLRPERAPAFSRKLAEAWLESEENSPDEDRQQENGQQENSNSNKETP